VYSVDTTNNRKLNYNYIEQGIYLHATALEFYNSANPLAQASSMLFGNPYYNQFSTFTFTTAHT
jgi:hypothetical protein